MNNIKKICVVGFIGVAVGLSAFANTPSTTQPAALQTQVASSKTTYNFILTASEATLAYANTKGTLTLQNVSGEVVAMSAFPQEHLTKLVSLKRFLAAWKQQANNGFGKDNPNAALVLLDRKKSIPLVLANPRMDPAGHVVFDVTVLNAGDVDNNGMFNQVALFVDNSIFDTLQHGLLTG